MALNPYDYPPRRLFIKRMGLPAVGVFSLGFLIMGAVANLPEVKGLGRIPSGIPPSKIIVKGSPPVAAWKQWAQIQDYLKTAPDVCWTGDAASQYQRGQCADYWSQFQFALLIGLIPFFVVIMFFMVGLDMLVSLYRLGRKKIQSGEGAFSGVVTMPAIVKNDAFGWFHCLQSIAVKKDSGGQVRVYFACDLPLPRPGQKLAVFDIGRRYGYVRHIAMVYAPHVAIVAGSR